MTDTRFGLDTSGDDAARLMTRFVRSNWITIEPALYRGKWFDYRFMNPVQATYLYAHEYVTAFRRAFSTNIDSRVAEFVKPLNVEALFTLPEAPMMDDLSEKRRAFLTKKHSAAITAKKTLISGIWKGRMVADAMGMPYDLYLDRAFHWTLRFWQQKHLPRPHQLYSDLVVDRATTDWEEHQKSDFLYSTLSQYRNDAYTSAQDNLNDKMLLHSHDAHHEWLFKQCEGRSNGHAILAQMVFHDQVLPLEKVRARLDEQGFERFMSFANSEPVIVRYN